jgi:hypothetical protein
MSRNEKQWAYRRKDTIGPVRYFVGRRTWEMEVRKEFEITKEEYESDTTDSELYDNQIKEIS